MANYTYTITSITGQIGTSAGTQTVTLELTPLPGFRLRTADFSINDPNNIYENIVKTKVGANVVITFDLIDSINYGEEDIESNLDLTGDAAISSITVEGDITFDDTPSDGFEFDVLDADGNLITDGILDVVVDGNEGDEIIVGELIIKSDEENELPDTNNDGDPDDLTIDLPTPFELGDGVLNNDGDLVYDIIVVIPNDDLVLGDVAVTTGDITDSSGGNIVTVPIEDFNVVETLSIENIDVNTDNLDGLNGGFIIITATGDAGAQATVNITPTVTPSTSSATYPAISIVVLIDSNGAFTQTVRIPSSATDASADNAICDPDTNDDVTNIDWSFEVVAEEGSEATNVVLATLKQDTTSKVTIRFQTNDVDVPQPVQGGAVISATEWTHDTVIGPLEEGQKFDGGFIRLTISPGADSWTLLGTAAEVAANLVNLKINEEISLVTADIDPGIDFCQGTASLDDDGNLLLFLEYSGGIMQNEDALYEIQLTNIVAFIRPAVVLNFTDGPNYTVSKKTITYVGSAAGATVTGTELSVVLTAIDGFTWHDTDFAATVNSFVANGHSQNNIASISISPTIASLSGLAFNGTPTSTITVSWVLQGVHGPSPALFDFTPTGGPKAISTVFFNSGDNNRGVNEAQTTMTIDNLSSIVNIEGRSWNKNYTITSDSGLVFDNPHLVSLTTSGDGTVAITGPTLVGAGPTYTQLDGALSGTHLGNSNDVNISINGNAYIDTDTDGDPDVTDLDDDGDGVADVSDAFPLDPTRSEIIFNTLQGDISSTNGDAIDVSFVLNHTIDASLIPSGDGVVFSVEGITLESAISVPYSDGTTTLRIQVPQSNGYDGSTSGFLTIRAVDQSDIVINVTQTETITTFSTTSNSEINHPNTGATAQTILVNTTNTGLVWTAVSSDPNVVNITSGSSGTGSGTVVYTASPNGFDAAATSATITLSAPGQTDIVITINVAVGVTTVWSLVSYSRDLPNNILPDQINNINITHNNPNLTWTAVSSDDAVVQIDSIGPNTGGYGSIDYTATGNAPGEPQTNATVTISSPGLPDLVYSITVYAGDAVTFTATPSPLNFDEYSTQKTITVASNSSTISWTAVIENENIAQIASNSTGVGTNDVFVSIPVVLPFDIAKSTNITFSSEGFDDIVVPINIAEGPTDDSFVVTPQFFQIPNDGQNNNIIDILASNSRSWTAVSSDVNIANITNGANGTGTGTITFNAASNTGEATPKEAIITVSSPGKQDQIVNVSIAPIELDELYAFPTYIDIANTGAVDNTITVEATNQASSWTAVSSNSSVVNITSGSSGTGNGTITYTASANSIGDALDEETITLSADGFDDIIIYINIAEGDPAVEIKTYESGTTVEKTSHAFDSTTTSTTMDVYVDSSSGAGGFTSTITGDAGVTNYNEFNFVVDTSLNVVASSYFDIRGSGSPNFPVTAQSQSAFDAKIAALRAAFSDPNVNVSITINGTTLVSGGGSLGGEPGYNVNNGNPDRITVFGYNFQGIASVGDVVTISHPIVISAFDLTPATGSDGTTAVTITPLEANTGTTVKNGTATITSVTDPSISKNIQLTQAINFDEYTTISVEAVDFDPTNAPTSTPLKFRFTSNNDATSTSAGWRQAGDAEGSTLPLAFAVPDPIPEGAHTARGGNFVTSPEFTFELPTPTISGTESFNALFSAIRLEPGAGQYNNYVDANGDTVLTSITVTTAPLAWSVDETTINLDNGGTTSSPIAITINDRRLAWTATSSNPSLVNFVSNSSGSGSGTLNFSAQPNSVLGSSAYSETITLSAPNVSDIVITINVAAANPESFSITDGGIAQSQLTINSTGSNATLNYAAVGGTSAYVYFSGDWDENLRDVNGNILSVNGSVEISSNPVRTITYQVQPSNNRVVFLDVSENTLYVNESIDLKVRTTSGNTENTITLKQAAADLYLNPSYLNKTITNLGSVGETILVTTNDSALNWTAVSSDPSIVNITSGSSGTGDGTVTYDAVGNGNGQVATFATITLSADGVEDVIIGVSVNEGYIGPATWAYFSNPYKSNEFVWQPFVYAGWYGRTNEGLARDTYNADRELVGIPQLGVISDGRWLIPNVGGIIHFLPSTGQALYEWTGGVAGKLSDKFSFSAIKGYPPYGEHPASSFDIRSSSWYAPTIYARGYAVDRTPYFKAYDGGVFLGGAMYFLNGWVIPRFYTGTEEVFIPSGTIKKLRLRMAVAPEYTSTGFGGHTAIGNFVANDTVLSPEEYYIAGSTNNRIDSVTLTQIDYGEVELSIDTTGVEPGSYHHPVKTMHYGLKINITVT